MRAVTFCIKRLNIAAWMKFGHFFPCCIWQNTSKISQVTAKKNLLCCIKKALYENWIYCCSKARPAAHWTNSDDWLHGFLYWCTARGQILSESLSQMSDTTFFFFVSLSPVLWGALHTPAGPLWSSCQGLWNLVQSRWSFPWLTGRTRHEPTRTNVPMSQLSLLFRSKTS